MEFSDYDDPLRIEHEPRNSLESNRLPPLWNEDVTNHGPSSPHSLASSDSPRSSVQSPPTPMPCTPMFSPPRQNDEPELPESLLQIGWRKFFSHRENRFYYFNKLTQKTQWDVPQDLERRKRPHSAENKKDVVVKKFIPCSDWELSICTNIRMQEVIPLAVFPPTPEIEIERADVFNKLTKQFIELCQAKDLDFSLDSLTSWLYERYLVKNDKNKEQFLPCNEIKEASSALISDLESSVPISLNVQNIPNVSEARKLLGKYAERARSLVDSHCIAEGRKQIKWHVNETFECLRSKDNNSFDDAKNRLLFLRENCGKLLVVALKPEIVKLVLRLQTLADEYAKFISEKHKHCMQMGAIDIREPCLPPPRERLVPCYSVQLRFASPRQQLIVTMQQTHEHIVRLIYNNHTQPIQATHFFKLEQLYRHNCFDDKRFDLFLARAFCMVTRYNTLFGVNCQRNGIFHRSLPIEVSRILHSQLGVTFEAFATPLNCFFRQFCSFYPDTDGYFGSRGSFLTFEPKEGSISVCPPPSPEVIQHAVLRVLELLESSDASRPLSFVVFIADLEAIADSLEMLESSEFKRGQKITLKKDKHHFQHPAKYTVCSKSPIQLSPFDTVIYVLQNEAAHAKWTHGQQFINAITHAFTFSDNNIDKPMPFMQN